MTQEIAPRLMVTGASGFVGGRLALALAERGDAVLAPARSPDKLPRHEKVVPLVCGSIDGDTDWGEALSGIERVVHLAARAHVMRDGSVDPLAEYRRVNVDATLNLARQAARAGVRRFVYVSSIKVNGEGTRPGVPYTAADAPAPEDAYGVSKLEAEEGLRRLCEKEPMELVVVRPVLVYGPGVRANFLALMRVLHRGWPLPLGAIHNRRSLVALDNLVDLLCSSLQHPAAAGQTFLASDGEDLSTTELLRRIARAMGTRAHLWPVPESLLRVAASAVGRGNMAKRLCGSLQVDIGKTRTLLGWQPPVSVDDALRRTAEHFLENLRNAN